MHRPMLLCFMACASRGLCFMACASRGLCFMARAPQEELALALDAGGQVYLFGTGENNEFAGSVIPPRCALSQLQSHVATVVTRRIRVLCRGVDADLILRLWAQRIAPELTRDEEGNELPVPKYIRCCRHCIAVLLFHYSDLSRAVRCACAREKVPDGKKNIRKEDQKIYELGKGKRPPAKLPTPRKAHEGTRTRVCVSVPVQLCTC